MNAGSRRKTRARTGIVCLVLVALAATLTFQAQGSAESGPQPPCGVESVPSYPTLDGPAVVKIWNRSDTGRDWRPPACTGWRAAGFTTLVSTVARFRYASGATGLLRHIGAISGLSGLRYWSTSHNRWQTLVVDAAALTDAQDGRRRADFTFDEMKEGTPLYLEQVDNLSGKGIYRMQVAEASADRLVVEIENVSTMRYHLIPILHPGDMQSIYFLDRESDTIWRFYSLMRMGENASWLVAGNAASAANRAVAFYRHMVGIPDDREPPAAR